MHSRLELSDVGGSALMSAVTAHQNTYLFYRTSPRTFDLYIYDWEKIEVSAVAKDGRVKPVIFAYLVPSSSGIAIVSVANFKVYLLSKTAAFSDVFDLTVPLEGERAHFAAPGPENNTFYLSSSKEDQNFYSLFDMENRSRVVLYSAPKDETSGLRYFLPFHQKHLSIQFGDGEIEVLDERFQSISNHPALFPKPSMISALGGKSKSIRGPFLAADSLTLNYSVKERGKRIDASARFSGKQLLFAAFRPLAVSPDGTQKMVLDYEADELKIVPIDFSFPEIRLPPTPGDQWPPEN